MDAAARQIVRRLTVTGQVQGVGFRPFVYNLAGRLGVRGHVSNDGAGVQILAVGSARQQAAFERALAAEQPPMAVVAGIESQETDAVDARQYHDFTIVRSGAGEIRVSVTPDAAVCRDCLDELFDPEDRRYLYPFINCTNCGPRYSLIRRLPYDRCHTTMAAFELCQACETEYRDPADRRFHAQPNACARCGPELSFHDGDGQPRPLADPIAEVVARIERGEILAIKGIGGFHLLCDARNPAAVRRLRERKRRPDKPFALMAANPESLTPWVELGDSARARLQGADAPVVLCRARDPRTLPGVAPGLDGFGVMLPHAPLHYLLFHAACGRPEGTAWLSQPQPLLLVMTSANRSGEPLITDNGEALAQLAGIADGFLLHNRDIHIRCDDSVVNGLFDPPALIRRGRGLAPQVIELAEPGPSVLAVGALFKNSVCVTRDDRAYVSQHIGDLDNPACCRTLTRTVDHLLDLFQIQPEAVVADLHPDFYSSRFAATFAEQRNIPLHRVQHHHAHIAAVMAEHRLRQPVIGLALDGLGMGLDGSLRGGELLRVDPRGCRQLGHLDWLPLPGGDRASTEPWRVAAGMLQRLGRGGEIETRFAEQPAAAMVRQMLERNSNSPPTTSAGRLFDGVAALLGIQQHSGYEAHAAMALEAAARLYLDRHPWPVETLPWGQMQSPLDLTPLLGRLYEIREPGYGAALFHRQLIDRLADWTAALAREQECPRVVLAGGCFLNQLLSDGIAERLGSLGLQVFRARQLPCNDAALALGQAQVVHFQQQ